MEAVNIDRIAVTTNSTISSSTICLKYNMKIAWTQNINNEHRPTYASASATRFHKPMAIR